MTTTLSVGEAKRRFSEIMGRVLYRGERFIVERHGTPAVALISLDDLSRLEQHRPAPKGLLPVLGALAEFEGFGEIMDAVYRERQTAEDRDVDFDR